MRKLRVLACSFALAATLAGPALAVSAPYATASLPPELSSRPAAETCPSLRSGTYRVISPTLGGTLRDQTGKGVLDAAKLTYTRPDGSQGTWEAQGSCRFVDKGADGYSVEYVVSKAGMFVGRVIVNAGSSFRVVIGFPEQAHALTELAGTWNVLGLRRGSENFYPDGGSTTFDQLGSPIEAVECGTPANWSIASCGAVPQDVLKADPPFVVDATGGFATSSPSRTKRLFLYKAGTGYPMVFGIASDGSFFMGAIAEAMDMPSVGLSTRSWNFDITGRLAAATNIYSISSITVETDAKLGSWVRSKQNIGLADEHLETLIANKPRNGYFTRPAGEAPTRGGAEVRMLRFNELTALNLPGMGFNVLVLPAVKLFEISVIHP